MKDSTVKTVTAAVRYVEPKHAASRFDAGNGQGTISKWTEGKTLDHPVLDGSTQGWKAEHDVPNPWRGLEDPALTRHPEDKRRGRWHWLWEK